MIFSGIIIIISYRQSKLSQIVERDNQVNYIILYLPPNMALSLDLKHATLLQCRYDRWMAGCRAQTMMRILLSCGICRRSPAHHRRKLSFCTAKIKHQSFSSQLTVYIKRYQSLYLSIGAGVYLYLVCTRRVCIFNIYPAKSRRISSDT